MLDPLARLRLVPSFELRSIPHAKCIHLNVLLQAMPGGVASHAYMRTGILKTMGCTFTHTQATP